MLQVEYRIKLGQDEFTLRAEVENELDFFRKMSFYSSLPKTGPNGETDLQIRHRTTKEGYNYYSLISEKAGMEFKFGQINDAKNPALYPKGWEPIYKGEGQGQSTVVVGTQQAPVGAPVGAPVVVGTQAAAPVGMPTPTQAPAVAPTTQVAPQATPEVAQVAQNVLARFNIGNKPQ